MEAMIAAARRPKKKPAIIMSVQVTNQWSFNIVLFKKEITYSYMHVVLFEIDNTNITHQFGNLGCRGEDAPNHVRQVNNKEEENVIVQSRNKETVHARQMAPKVWIPEFATNAHVNRILRAKLKCVKKNTDIYIYIFVSTYTLQAAWIRILKITCGLNAKQHA